MFEFYPYQEQGIQRVRQCIAQKIRRIIIHAPTGSGKTVIASGIIHSATTKKKNVIFVAHRKELIDQASAKLDSFSVPHGVIMSGHWRRRYDSSVQVASIQTWRSWSSRASMVQLPPDLEAMRDLPSTDIDWRTIPSEYRQALFMLTFRPHIVFIDECHLSISKSYVDMVASFPSSVLLGLTATPVRNDGLPLSDLYDKIVSISTPAKLMDQGYLVPPRHFAPPIPDLSNIRQKNHDYDPEELANALDRPDLIGDIVKEWLQRANGRPTLCFAVNRRHSRNICQQFMDAGIPAEHLDGDCTKQEREAGIQRLMYGQTKVITNVGIFTEGTDFPYVSCVILARATKSLALYLQMGGRGLRTFGEEKKDCIVLDHGGCFHAHGPLDADRKWTLDGKKKRKKPAKPKPKVCPSCNNIYSPNASACPACGFAPEVSGFTLTVDATKTLDEMSPSEIRMKLKKEEEAAKTLDELLDLARRRGYKEAWAHRLYEARQLKYLAMRYPHTASRQTVY